MSAISFANSTSPLRQALTWQWLVFHFIRPGAIRCSQSIMQRPGQRVPFSRTIVLEESPEGHLFGLLLGRCQDRQ